jgi:hypothetical protein
MALRPEQYYDAIRLMAQPKAVRPTNEKIALLSRIISR